jgi:hypothetical protein
MGEQAADDQVEVDVESISLVPSAVRDGIMIFCGRDD